GARGVPGARLGDWIAETVAIARRLSGACDDAPWWSRQDLVLLASLDLLELGEQILGHPDRGGVDEAPVERNCSLALGGCVLHRGDDPVRLGDDVLVGREDVVGQRDL